MTVNDVENTIERYEFRIELSVGSPCHCVAPIGSFGLVQEWNNGDALCNSSVISPYYLCASNSQHVIYLTKQFRLSNGRITKSIHNDNCNQHSGEDMNYIPTYCPENSTASTITTTQIMNSTLSLSGVPSPTPEIFCSEDGIWKQTTACTSTTLQVCSPDHKTNG